MTKYLLGIYFLFLTINCSAQLAEGIIERTTTADLNLKGRVKSVTENITQLSLNDGNVLNKSQEENAKSGMSCLTNPNLSNNFYMLFNQDGLISEYRQDFNSSYTSSFIYDQKHRLLESFDTKKDGTISSRTKYKYAEAGFMTHSNRTAYDLDLNTFTNREIQYNHSGDEIMDVLIIYGSDTSDISNRKIIPRISTEISDGLKVMKEFRYNSKGSIENIVETKYDSQNNPYITVMYTAAGNEEWKRSRKFNSNGDCIEDLFSKPDGATEKTVKTYSRDGVKTEEYENGKLMYWFINRFDSNKNIIEYKNDKGTWNKFKFNELGLETENLSLKPDGTELSKLTRTYTPNGTVIEIEEYYGGKPKRLEKYNHDGSPKVLYIYESNSDNPINFTYEYDTAGNWIKCVMNNSRITAVYEREINYY